MGDGLLVALLLHHADPEEEVRLHEARIEFHRPAQQWDQCGGALSALVEQGGVIEVQLGVPAAQLGRAREVPAGPIESAGEPLDITERFFHLGARRILAHQFLESPPGVVPLVDGPQQAGQRQSRFERRGLAHLRLLRRFLQLQVEEQDLEPAFSQVALKIGPHFRHLLTVDLLEGGILIALHGRRQELREFRAVLVAQQQHVRERPGLGVKDGGAIPLVVVRRIAADRGERLQVQPGRVPQYPKVAGDDIADPNLPAHRLQRGVEFREPLVQPHWELFGGRSQQQVHILVHGDRKVLRAGALEHDVIAVAPAGRIGRGGLVGPVEGELLGRGERDNPNRQRGGGRELHAAQEKAADLLEIEDGSAALLLIRGGEQLEIRGVQLQPAGRGGAIQSAQEREGRHRDATPCHAVRQFYQGKRTRWLAGIASGAPARQAYFLVSGAGLELPISSARRQTPLYCFLQRVTYLP